MTDIVKALEDVYNAYLHKSGRGGYVVANKSIDEIASEALEQARKDAEFIEKIIKQREEVRGCEWRYDEEMCGLIDDYLKTRSKQ